MRRHFVSGFPGALLSLSQEKSSGVEIGRVKIRLCWQVGVVCIKERNDPRSYLDNLSNCLFIDT